MHTLFSRVNTPFAILRAARYTQAMDYFLVFENDLPWGVGIRAFGPEHTAWLLASAAVIFLLCLAAKKVSGRTFRTLQWVMCALVLACEANRQLCLLSAGVWGVYTLPLHLCSMSVFLVLWHCIRGGTLAGELLWCLTMPGAVFAIIFPDWLYYPAWNLLSLGTFLGHMMLAAYPAFCTARGLIRPDAKRLPKCFLCLLCTAAVIFVFNKLVDANYFFLNGPAPDSPLSLAAQYLGDPGYLVVFLPILATVWALLYLPLRLRPRSGGYPSATSQ